MIQAELCYVRDAGDQLELVIRVPTETGDATLIATVSIGQAANLAQDTTKFVTKMIRRGISAILNAEKKSAGKPSAGLPGIVYRTRTVNIRSSENGKVAATP